jgi:ribosomal protein S18 acetylase RimI-like enzyme
MHLATTSALPLPAPTVDIAIRPATVDDIPAIDRLQKPHSRELGFFPRAQLQGYIEKHGVLVAERAGTRDGGQGTSEMHGSANASSLDPRPSTLLGYIAYSDRYLKRDELGIVVQLCVDPTMRRSFIGAALLKAAFERSSYGCKLYCCWCAQDLAANRFWESMGFVPLAFRTGSVKKKGLRDYGTEGPREEDGRAFPSVPYPSVPQSHCSPRIHIFWQKRIRAGDATTPFWFPSKTEGGALREDRIILPIPPGVHWSDVMPVILPTAGPVGREETERRSDEETESRRPHRKSRIVDRKSPPPVYEPPLKLGSMLRFAKAKPQIEAKPVEPKDVTEPTPDAQPVRAKRAAKRCASTDAGEPPAGSTKRYDPTLIAKARELRDRWMEQVDRDPSLLMPTAKYDVARLIAPTASHEVPLLGHQQAA